MEIAFLYNGEGTSASDIRVEIYRESLTDFDEIVADINSYIVDLVYADPTKDITVARAKVKNFIEKKNIYGKMGIVSELMAHILVRKKLHMNHLSLMVSLEDSGMKKGFDGVYERNNEVWFGESKSTMTDGAVHAENIDEALRCFRNKINGTAPNNPWNNAITHFYCLQNGVKATASIKKRISDLSDDFEKRTYTDTDEFNILPISTLFVNDSQSLTALVSDIDTITKRFDRFNKMIVLCINNELFARIVDYLEGR